MADEREPWVIPSDIPEHPTETLVFIAPGGRRWESEPMPEGTFDYLRAKVPNATAFAEKELAVTEDTLARVCDERDAARADARMMTHLVVTLGKRVRQLEDDLVYRLEGLPLPETDYAELGYPETRVTQCWDLDMCAETLGVVYDRVLGINIIQDDVEKG